MLWFYSVYDRRVTGPVDLKRRADRRERGRGSEISAQTPCFCPFTWSIFMCLKTAKTSLKTRSWRVLKDISIRQKQYAGKEMNYLSHTVHLPDHGGLNCTHRALNAKKCSIWRHRFKPKFPLRSLTNCSVLWDSQLLHISQTAMVTEGMTTWSAWETDQNTHLTADYRGALESKLLTGTEAIFNRLCSLCQIIQLYTHRLSRHWHFWEIINEKPDNHWSMLAHEAM